MSERWGCYVHVPWCRSICPYCSFYVVRDTGAARHTEYVEAVLREHSRRVGGAFAGPASTLFFGGGTPSRLPVESLATLIDNIPVSPGAEISAEANPEDVSDDWLEGALGAGINRISLGVQTFRVSQSKRLGRAHTRAQASSAAQRLQKAALRSWSMDLIFAVPGQSVADLDDDLDHLLALEPPHVALYGLTLEPGTPLGRAAERGRLTPVDSETWRRMYDRIVSRLEVAGLRRYEVSNFAAPGHESSHNQGYWLDRPYMGLGPSAHGYRPDGVRYRNPADLALWLQDPGSADEETPEPGQRAIDILIACLRGQAGVDLHRLRQRTGMELREPVLRALEAASLLTREGLFLRLTPDGFPLADGITARLVDALVPVAGHKES
ncbi:MAG: oxygen-independent coproporphyrinogen-3 oxidase [Myxococcota bacterium]|jgi:oxygen-independent coproporphyrinogen-3 oxidase